MYRGRCTQPGRLPHGSNGSWQEVSAAPSCTIAVQNAGHREVLSGWQHRCMDIATLKVVLVVPAPLPDPSQLDKTFRREFSGRQDLYDDLLKVYRDRRHGLTGLPVRAASELLQTPPSCVAPAATGPSCSGSLSHYAPPWQQLIKAAPAASVPSCACANEPSCPGCFRIALLLIRAATAASVSRQQQLNRVAPAASALRCN